MSDEYWQNVLTAVNFYAEIKDIIKYGKTTVCDRTCEDYNNLEGYQAVLRECGDKALLIVHTFENGADPDIDKYLEGYDIKEAFGNELSGDFRGKAFLLEKQI